MKKLFEKKQWKDILILVILMGITFLRYNSYKKIEWFLTTYIIISIPIVIYALIYTLYNCKNNKERKWLSLIYLSSLIFMHVGDIFDVFIYFLVAAIFLENRDNFLKWYFIISTIIIGISIASYFLEIVPSSDRYRGDSLRYSLGFVHPNSVFRFFFGSLIPLYIMDKKKTLFNIYAIGFGIPLYILTNSRTGLICVMSFVFFANIAIIFEKLIKKVSFRYAFLFFSIFSIVFTLLFYESKWFNMTLSNRPKLWYDLLINAKWHLIYGNMDFIYCDNRFVYVIIRNGLLALVLTNLFYYFVFKKENSVELKVVFFMSLVYGLTENYRALGQTIVPLLCVWSLYDNYLKNKLTKNDKKIQNLTKDDNKLEC